MTIATLDSFFPAPVWTSPTPSTEATPPLRDGAASVYSFDENLLVFDWDDTLLPSTWIANLGVGTEADLPALDRVALALTSQKVCELILSAARQGHVAILTNAERGWVEWSSSRYCPEVLHVVRFCSVPIISARSCFEHTGGNPAVWKYRSFEQMIDNRRAGRPVHWGLTGDVGGYIPLHILPAVLLSEDPLGPLINLPAKSKVAPSTSKLNLLSIGDSEAERQAMLAAGASMAGAGFTVCRKSLKMSATPDASRLLAELDALIEGLGRLAAFEGDLDLALRCEGEAEWF